MGDPPRRRAVRRLLAVVLGVVAALLIVALVRAFTVSSRQVPSSPGRLLDVDAAAAAQRLAGAVRIPTVSQEGPPPAAEMARLHDHLAASYPRLHATLQREVIEGGTLLFTWRGTDASARPLLLTGHMDVVPVDPTARWTRPAFAGDVADGFVWGRGTLDDKAAVLALCEAVEGLLARGWTPRRSVMLAFGHDEEIGGARGAARVAELLASRGVRPELVLDEGMVIVEGLLPGVSGPVALIGVAEKGSLTLELKVELAGGHSSMPAPESAVGVLAGALHRLERNPLPTALTGVARGTFDHAAPEMSLVPRVIFANPWLFGPLVRSRLEAGASGAALLRTTTALTVVQAGVKENVIPPSARALVNFRLLPGDTGETVVAHVRRVVDDPRVTLRPTENAVEASPVAPTEGPAYEAIARAVRDAMPETIVAPGLVLGQTDGRHYQRLGAPVYRFAPYRFAPSDLPRVHGTDERVPVEDHARAIRVYARLIESAGT